MSSRYRTLAHGVRARHPGDAGSAVDVVDVAGELWAPGRRGATVAPGKSDVQWWIFG